MPPPIPCPALGPPASRRPPLDLGGYPRSRLPEEARPRPGAADRTLSELTLQLLAFVLLGLVFFEQAGQHGRLWLGVGKTGPSLRLREPVGASAHPERSHVTAVSRDAGASLSFWRWVVAIELKEGSGWLVGGRAVL